MRIETGLTESLTALYSDPGAQSARYRQALTMFGDRFGPGPVTIFRAPGRANLIGEHTDYNNGFVLPLAIERDLLLLARRRADNRIRLANAESAFAARRFAIMPDMNPAPRGDWSNYVRGAAARLCRENSVLCGVDLLVDGRPPWGLPHGAGLSSSSALTAGTLFLLADLNNLNLSRRQLALLAGEAERFSGTQGGMMDQFTILLAQKDHLLFMDCSPGPDGVFRQILPVSCPEAFRFAIIDSGVRHDNTGGAYNRRVAAGQVALIFLRQRDLNVTSLRDVQSWPWPDIAGAVPESLTVAEAAATGLDIGQFPGLEDDLSADLQPLARVYHVWTENDRVLAAVSALQRSDMATLEALLLAGQRSAKEYYGISTPELDLLVELANEVPGVAGARLTGAGWGGAVIAPVRREATQKLVERIQKGYRSATGKDATIWFTDAAGPVQRVAEVMVES